MGLPCGQAGAAPPSFAPVSWTPAAPSPPPQLPLAAALSPLQLHQPGAGTPSDIWHRSALTPLRSRSVPIAMAGSLQPATKAMGSPARTQPALRAGGATPPDQRLLALLPPDLRPLAVELQRHGFRLRLAPPPVPGAYGQYVPASRTLWLAPIAFDLGIGRTTFLHEAVHAVQSCPGGTLTPIGWRLGLEPVVRQEIGGILSQRYHHDNRLLEQEAFALQGQADAVPRLRAALRSRCTVQR